MFKIDYEKLRNFCLKQGYEKPLIFEKDSERYIFLYDNNSTRELFCQLGKYAANPDFSFTLFQQLGTYAQNQDLSFTWYGAAILSQEIKGRRAKKLRENNESMRKILLENL